LRHAGVASSLESFEADSSLDTLKAVLTSLGGATRGIGSHTVRNIGRVRRRRTRQGKERWTVDLRPLGETYSVPGFGALRTREEAEAVLGHIRGELGRGEPIEAILAQYLPRNSKPLRIEEQAFRWLALMERRVEAGDRSPTYFRELQRYLKREGHIGAWWFGKSIHDITTPNVEDWALIWLPGRKISAKTRRNVVAAFHTFARWLKRRGQLRQMPEFPGIPVDEHSPTIIDDETQDSVLDAIPGERRGAFLAMAYMGLRPGEVRALNMEDYDPRGGMLKIRAAMKGCDAQAPRRGTKTRKARVLPIPREVGDWLEQNLAPEARLRGGEPLFPNVLARNPERRWTYYALRDEWLRACEKAGIRVKLYEGTKHAMASSAVRRGVDLKRVKDALGHADIRSTERYAKLADHALVTAFRSRSRPREPQESPRISDIRTKEIREVRWRPQRDSNPRCRRERPESWAGLDDGDG